MAKTIEDELVSLLGLWTTEWHALAASPVTDRPSKAAYLANKVVDYYSGVIDTERDEAYNTGYDAGVLWANSDY